MPTKNIPLICYDLVAVSRFFRSVALAIAFQRHTRIEWETYRDSGVLNAVYTVLFWKEPPGTAEIRVGSRAQIEDLANQLHQQFLLAWIDKLYQGGPVAGNEYVNHMLKLREFAREAVQEVFRDAQQINNEVINQTTEAIVALARIRLAATVGVAVIGGAAGIAFAGAAMGGAAAGGVTVFGLEAGASSLAFAGTGFGYSATNSLIKTWEQGPSAKMAAVGIDTGKAVASEVGGAQATKAFEKALEQQARSSQIIRSAEGQIAKHSQRLAQEGLKKGAQRKARNIIGQSTAQIARETAAMGQAGKAAGVARFAGKGIPVVFAAWDIIDAFGDYGDTMKAVGR